MSMLFVQISSAQYKGHGAESVSAEDLKRFAPPPLNPVMINKLKKMFDVTSPGMGMLSPDHKTLYFTWRVTGQSQVWKIDGPQKFPVQLTSGQDAVSISAVSPDGKFLILSKDLNGQESPGIYLLDLKSGQMKEIYRKEKVNTFFGFITKDSQTIYYTANDEKVDSYNIYKQNIATGERQLIYKGDGNWYLADEWNQGQKILLVKYKGARQKEYFDLDVETQKLTPVIGQNENKEYEVSYLKANEFLVLAEQNDFKRLFHYKNLKLKIISDPKLNFDVSEFSMNEQRTRVSYTINREGFTELKAMNARTFKPIDLPKFPNADHVFLGSTTRDGHISMLGVVTAKSPRLSYSYDWRTQKLTQWVMPSAPEVDLESFSGSQLMKYKTRDQIEIPMIVRFPKNCEATKDCPVVVHFHGGPEGQSVPGFSTMAQAFVDEGFIFVEPNVRGSEGYGQKWLDADNKIDREKVITDIEDAALWIKENWKNVKGQSPQIGVMGWSYGGYSTFFAMTKFAGAYQAGVALVGMSDLVSFIQNTAPYRRTLRISEYGNPEVPEELEAMKRLSPVKYIDQIKDPLLIIQGVNDPRVPAGEALQIYKSLEKRKLNAGLILFADEGHGSAKKENQILEIGHTIEFFKKHLK